MGLSVPSCSSDNSVRSPATDEMAEEGAETSGIRDKQVPDGKPNAAQRCPLWGSSLPQGASREPCSDQLDISR